MDEMNNDGQNIQIVNKENEVNDKMPQIINNIQSNTSRN